MPQIDVTKMLDGRKAVFHVSILGDGSGELVDAVIVDPTADLDPPMPAAPTFKLDQIWYDLNGFSGRLEYDYLTSDTPAWTMSGNGGVWLDFSCIGGIADRSPSDGTGKLKITTSGLELGDFGTFIITIDRS
jgi:hypothetical protein